MNLVLMKKKNKFQFVEQITIAAAHLGGGLFVYCDQPSSHRVRRIGGFFHATHQFAPSVRRFNLTAPPFEFQCSILKTNGADRLARYAFRCPTFGILQGNVPFPLIPTPPQNGDPYEKTTNRSKVSLVGRRVPIATAEVSRRRDES